ncbi:MAG: hypothetical protein E7594_05495 [Ruminococcaceae bacterium]|nr:hypothetical protein [Oscillospiraceae bacterium]
MKQLFKYYLPYASISAITIALLLLLGNPILRTVANAIVGEEWGKVLAGYAMGLILPFTLFTAFHIWRARNPGLRRDYFNSTRDCAYSPKQDRQTILKSKEFRMDLIGMAAIALLLTILYMPLYIIIFPLFVPFDLLSWRYLHKSWSKDRLDHES